MNNPIIISAVSYLNTKPFIYGIERSGYLENYRLELDFPSACAEKLIRGKADIGLIPVASVSLVPDAEIITDYCIGALDRVGSVLLVSEVPLPEINSILLDYQSKTSAALVQVLALNFWKLSVRFEDGSPGFENSIRGNRAGIIIGDRAFEAGKRFPYIYDLAGEWKTFTGKPFVFAVWVANKKINPSFLESFNRALYFGTEHVEEMLKETQGMDTEKSAPADYFTHCISYPFDFQKKEGMKLFLKYAGELKQGTITKGPLNS